LRNPLKAERKMTIRHQETKTVFGLWNAAKAGGKVPARGAIEPRSFARHLGQICLLEKSGPDATIRLGGTSVCALFGKELRGGHFGALFTRGARLSVQAALARGLTLSQPMVIEAIGETESGRQIGVEILLLPLSDAQGHVTQALAYLQPLDPIARLVGEPLTAFRFLGMSEAIVSGNDLDGGTGPRRPVEAVKAAARPNLRLVVSNPMAAAANLLRRARPEAALGLVT
jgi:hypothetical protein